MAKFFYSSTMAAGTYALFALLPGTAWASDTSSAPLPAAEADEDSSLPGPVLAGSVALSLGHNDVGNGFRYTAEPLKPMLVADVSARLSNACSVGVYAVRAIRHSARAGDVQEIDPRVSCDVTLGKKITLTVGVEQWFTTGPNVTVPSVSFAHGPVDVIVKYLRVNGRPNGQRAEIGFTPKISPTFDLRLAGGIERGLGSKPVAVVYATAEQKLDTNSRWSLFGEAVYGFAEHGDSRRGGKVHVGVRFSF
jgi:hypothetical protein